MTKNKSITNPKKIQEILTRRVEKIYPSKKALEKLLLSGKKIRLYLGIDPTAPHLHLGHTVPLRIIQSFADLGHEVILLFGTGTVLVGDPSEREKGRKLITEKEIEKNITTWKDQVKPIIDFKKIKVKCNGDWLTKLTLKDIIKIGSKISAIQLFKRENFTRRIKAGNTVWYHETMYPLMQGYDSVAMNVDLEVGGTDQTFNMLIGRELQKKINNKEKFVLTNKMIVGTDSKKMSKTSGNCIWLTDNPNDMYGKLMKVQDELIPDYFEFFTELSMNKVKALKKKLAASHSGARTASDRISSKINPMTLKKQLAFAITKQFHSQKKAQEAQKHFEQVFQSREVPKKVKSQKLKVKSWNILDLLVETKLASSKSEAKRLIKQEAIRINNKPVKGIRNIKITSGIIINVGRKKWLKIR